MHVYLRLAGLKDLDYLLLFGLPYYSLSKVIADALEAYATNQPYVIHVPAMTVTEEMLSEIRRKQVFTNVSFVSGKHDHAEQLISAMPNGYKSSFIKSVARMYFDHSPLDFLLASANIQTGKSSTTVVSGILPQTTITTVAKPLSSSGNEEQVSVQKQKSESEKNDRTDVPPSVPSTAKTHTDHQTDKKSADITPDTSTVQETDNSPNAKDTVPNTDVMLEEADTEDFFAGIGSLVKNY